jgi:undecaprenyl-phosphate galactose phosphotransferase/putative colanic acid biosynthesis UDP-glucose lipid carrier transferase
MESVLNRLSKKKFSKYTKLILFTSELLLLNSMYFLSFLLRFGELDRLTLKEPKLILILSNIFWVGISYNVKFYKLVRIEKFQKQLIKTTKVFIVHFFLIAILIVSLKLSEVSRLRIFYFYFLSYISILFFRYYFILAIKKIRIKGYNYRNVLFIGYNETTNQIKQFLNSNLSFGYKIIGYFNSKQSNVEIDYLGEFEKSINYIKKHKIDEIYISMSDKEINYINEIISISEKLMIRIKIIPNLNQYSIYRKMSVDYYNNTPVLLLLKEPLEDPVKEVSKRLFDILFSLLIIIFIYPWLIVIISILIKITSRGPVFFKQLRTGMNGKDFYCYKFRTMKINPKSDEKQASENDTRVTKIGKILRKSNLDEFPQFFNVLFGQMSIVGPRPHMLKHTKDFTEIKDNYLIRHYVKPGITGWAQVNGYRGETKTEEDIIKRVEYDIWYIENWNFLLDLKIIWLTVWNMIKGEKNAY